jgi:hypothetical protein
MRKSGRNDVLAMVRLQWGRAAVTGGQPDVARRELDAALAEARNGGKPEVIARLSLLSRDLRLPTGALDEGTRVADEALALAANSDRRRTARAGPQPARVDRQSALGIRSRLNGCSESAWTAAREQAHRR